MSSRLGSLVGSFVFFWLAPATVAGWLPYMLSGWRVQRPFFGISSSRFVGGLVAACGVAVLVECFTRFALKGRGTPAPVAPTENLVVSGLYRHVRNPMYLAVLAVIVGQSFLFGSRALVWYAGIVWVCFHVFVRVYEEPTLHRQFGSPYDTYRSQVPRWLPRMKPWSDSGNS
jgi:protein-S-isoprenylcysteine O-methyltransferase Ste14